MKKTIQNKISIIFSTLIYNIILWCGILVPLYCYYLVPGVDILKDPLSRFGIEGDTKIIWFIFAIIMSFVLLINGLRANYSIHWLKRNSLNYILYFSTLGFLLSGVYTMEHKFTHLLFASLFFFLYTLYIFLYGLYSSRKLFIYSSVISFINFSALFLTFYFNISYAIFEFIFICSVIIWNYILKYK